MSVNPRFYKGSAMLEKSKEASAGSLTWQAGQFYRTTDSGITPVLSDGSQISGIYAETQAVATTAGDKVWVHAITQPDQLFQMSVTSAGTDTKAGSAYVSGNYGVAVNSCVATISVGNASTPLFHVYGVVAAKEPFLNDTSDVPGQLICGVNAAVLTV